MLLLRYKIRSHNNQYEFHHNLYISNCFTSSKKGTLTLFKGMASGIIKRHKWIVAFWLIIFIITLPSLQLINNVIVYQETEVSPLNTASQNSQKVINEEFPSLLPKTSAVIVLKGNDVSSVSVRDLLLALENQTWNENQTGKLHKVTSVLTLYSIYRSRILEPVILRIAPMLSSGEDLVNTTAYMLFELPTQFYINYSQLDLNKVDLQFALACAKVFQPPSIFVESYASAAGNNSTRAQIAYNKTAHQVNSSWLPYLDTFAYYWNDSWNTVYNFPTDTERAQWALKVAAPEFFGLATTETVEKRMLSAALSNLDIVNWNNSVDQHRASMVYSNGEASVLAWDVIFPTLNTTEQVAQSSFLKSFYDVWNSSFFNSSTADLAPLDRAEYSKNLSIPMVLAQFPMDDQTKGMIMGALKVFNLTNWKDKTLVHKYTMDTVIAYAQTLFGFSVPSWFLDQVYALGPNVTESQVAGLARDIVLTHTVGEFPIPLPAQILSTFIDSKNNTMLVVIGFDGDPADLLIQENIIRLRKDLGTLTSSRQEWRSIKTYVTGLSGIDYDMRSSAEADARLIEPFTALLVIVFIALYFRSGVAPWVPLATVGMAYVMSQAAMWLIGTYIGGIHYTIRLVTFTMIMGAGSDYCIFIVSRFREERILGRNKDEAIKTAIIWAGESIATSGATVMVAFLALALFSFPLVQVMGMCLAVSIGITLLMALTMIPALLYWMGDWVFWPTMGERWKKYRTGVRQKMKEKKGYFYRAARVSLKHAGAIVALCLLVSIPTTYLVYTIEPSYDFLGSMANVEAKKGVDAMAQGFGAGNILPTYVVVKFDGPLLNETSRQFDTEKLNATDGLASALGNLSTVFKVSSSAYNTMSGARIDRQVNWTAAELSLSLGASNRTTMLTVVLKDQPSSSNAVHAIAKIRSLCQDYNHKTPALANAKVYIGGTTAGTADIGATVAHDFPISAALVLLGVYIILLFVLGSVMIPFRLMLTILLSISWTLAMAMIIFLWFLSIPVLWIMPLLLFVILMGLGMDYDIFLMTRVKEAVLEGKSDDEAISEAVQSTGSIITICGVIMAGAFGTMMLSSTGMLQEFGFGLCFAILLDATIVRIYLVPAIMVLLKKWNWWAPFGIQKVKR